MITLDGFELPEEMIWTDEFEWSTVKAVSTRTIQGKHIVRESQVPDNAGRPISLTSADAWATREDVILLRAMTDDMLRVLTLIINDDSTYQVRFRHWEPPPFSAEMVLPTAFPTAETWYRVNMKLAVIE